ncbi:hypothetical protein GCM10010211_46750 [Streptomyces albospinus]|uniref:Uncharacterized protein n=1 Tax=Streptomyces albospinus TaxID=285515 RepID=A0ABQ2VAR2_9ACTN|nr:hypothetical protein GCM10010211_46750 [Streptomyces albospinus]
MAALGAAEAGSFGHLLIGSGVLFQKAVEAGLRGRVGGRGGGHGAAEGEGETAERGGEAWDEAHVVVVPSVRKPELVTRCG